MKEYIKKLEEENALLRKRLEILEETLRELTQRTSKNSSTPPSLDRKPNAKEPRKKGGAKPGHPAQLRKLLPECRVDRTEIHKMDSCPRCGSIALVEKKIETPFQFIEFESGRCVVTEHHCCRYYCSSCKKRFSSPLPDGVGPSNYGPRFQASIGILTGQLHLSKRQTAELMEHLFNISISDGTICKIERRLSRALEPAYEQVADKVKQASEIAYVDETTWRCQQKNCYVWLAASKVFSFFRIDSSRSRNARDLLLGKKFKGRIVTDRYCAYSNLKAPHQYCLAHLKRNFKKFSEGKDIAKEIAEGLICELDKVFHFWKLFQGNGLSFQKLKQKCYSHRLKMKELLEYGEALPNGKFQRFCVGLLEQFDRFWTFLRVPGMEPTNNEAERSLRSLVLWRKCSLGTQSEAGKRYVSIISTVCQTLKKQGRHLLSFLASALRAEVPHLV